MGASIASFHGAFLSPFVLVCATSRLPALLAAEHFETLEGGHMWLLWPVEIVHRVSDNFVCGGRNCFQNLRMGVLIVSVTISKTSRVRQVLVKEDLARTLSSITNRGRCQELYYLLRILCE